MKNSKFLPILFTIAIACSSDPDPEIDCSSFVLSIDVLDVRNPSRCNGLDGLLEVNAIGLTPPVEYQINNGALVGSGLFENLGAGTYEITAQDVNDCSVSESITLEEPISISSIAEVNSTPSGCGESQASLEVLASGGPNLMYSIDGATFQVSNSFSNLSAGAYMVTVRDSTCQSTAEHNVVSGVSFNGTIESIITSNCAVSNCHVAGTGLPNFNIFTNVQSAATQIKSRTQNRSMPPSGGSLSQQDIDLIACWVDDGALDN